MILAQTVLEIYAGQSCRVRNFRLFFERRYEPEEDGDVISGVVVGTTSVKFRAKFGGSRSNCSRDI